MNPNPKQKTPRFKGRAYSKFRLMVSIHFGERCLSCGGYAPLFDRDGVYDVFTCGHVSHIRSKGAGGGDTIENVRWECYECHINRKHGPRWNYLE